MCQFVINRKAVVCLAVSVVLRAVSSTSAQTVTQQFNLRAGWNTIWLETEPANPEIGAVFTNVPLTSVWRCPQWTDGAVHP